MSVLYSCPANRYINAYTWNLEKWYRGPCLFCHPCYILLCCLPDFCRRWSSWPLFYFLWLSVHADGWVKRALVPQDGEKLNMGLTGTLKTMGCKCLPLLKKQIQRGKVTCSRSRGRLSRPGTVTSRLGSDCFFLFKNIFSFAFFK